MALVAPTIADKLKKNIVLVRKESEARNSDLEVEGHVRQRCVFIDDLIGTSRTFYYVARQLAQIEGEIVGYLTYHSTDSRRKKNPYIDDIPFWGRPDIKIKRASI